MSERLPAHRLLNDPLRPAVERLVSQSIGRDWRVIRFQDLNDYASHPSGLLSDGTFSVFAKFSDATHGLDQFEVELAGLVYLSKQAGVQTPVPLGVAAVEGGALLVMEAVKPVVRGPEQWREIGRTLARIHQVRGERFGFERQGYFGPLYQDNRPLPDWLSFFAERRLWPRLVGAIDSGHLTGAMIQQVERVIDRLHRLDLPDSAPTLLHGDAQKNNWISTSAGAVVIDPALYYGHPEIDLAYIDYFEAVPADVFWGYQEVQPIAPGLEARRDLWRLPAYLAAVTVEGPIQLEKLWNALARYR